MEQRAQKAVLTHRSTGNHHLVGSGLQQIMRQHRCFHTRAAHFVDRGATGGQRESCAEAGLACRCLALPGRQYTTHDDFIDRVALKLASLDCSGNRGRTELCRGGSG